MISIINYELGNVISVQNALNKLGYKNVITERIQFQIQVI